MRPWIDTHVHLLYPQRLHYDWLSGALALNHAFHLEDYEALARPLGITQALHVEADVRANEITAETAWVLGLAQPGSLLVGAIASCRPERQDMAAHVQDALANPRVHGFRRVLHVVPDTVSTSPTFRRNVRTLTAQGHPFDVCVRANQLPLADALAQACPNAQLVLDHCGVPDVAAQALMPWKEDLARVARHPNMACKLSGLIAYGDATRWGAGDTQAVARDLRPFVEHLLACFGWSRVVWGSDFPVCNLTRDLPTWKAVTDELLQGCSAAEIDALAFDNARRIYRLPAQRVPAAKEAPL